MDVPIDPVDCDDTEEDSATLWEPDHWIIPYVLPAVPHELEYPAAIQYINTALAGDLDLGDRLPLSENVSEMVDKCKDGLILAKLTNSVIPGAIDMHALNKPKKYEALSMSEMIENNTIVSRLLYPCRDLGERGHLVTRVVNGEKNWIFQLVSIIIWHGLRRKACEAIMKCDLMDLYRLLGQNMTLLQFINLKCMQMVYKWFECHLNAARWYESAFDVNDNKDGKTYIVVLHQLDPELCSLEPLAAEDPVLRAKQVLDNAERLRCRNFLTPTSLVAGCKNAHLAFIVNLFSTFIGRDSLHEGEPVIGLARRLLHPNMIKRAYEPLNREIREFRLLTILPSKNRNEDIHGFLTHHDLDVGIVNANGGTMSFLTLSYTWGDAEPMGKAYITDQEIQVRPNLVAALKHLRQSEHYLCEIWVDALCIDQKNTEERNHQVGLMDAIYSKSRRVVSWLGDQSETSHLAITHLNRVRAFYQSWHENRELDHDFEAFFHGLMTDRAYEDHWNALYHLFSRPYWSRLWIVQEVLLNESPHSAIVCGDDSVLWEVMDISLHAFQLCLRFAPQTARKAMTAAKKVTKLCQLRVARQTANKRTISFLDALVLGRERSAMTSADHVYGILGLIDHQGLQVMPNYEESTMVVFRNAMQHIVQTDGNLDILSACKSYEIANQQCHNDKIFNTKLCRRSNGFEITLKPSNSTYERELKKSTDLWDFFKRLACAQLDPQAASQETTGSKLDSGPTEGLVAQMKRYLTPWPSWLPDWTLPLNDHHRFSITYLLLSEPKPRFYSAGGHHKPKLSFDRMMPALGISGFRFCSIAHVGPDDESLENAMEREQTRWQWYQSLENVRNPYGNEIGKRTAFVLLQILGKDSDGNEATFKSSFASEASLLSSCLETDLMSSSQGAQTTDDVSPRGVVKMKRDLNLDLKFWDLDFRNWETHKRKIEIDQIKLRDTGEDESEVKDTANVGGDTEDEVTPDMYHFLVHLLWESRLFVTEQGYIGRGPLSIEKGDSVCIFPGGKTPYILCDAGNGGYYLRGECYVQGIMEGEAMMRPHELKEFVLR